MSSIVMLHSCICTRQCTRNQQIHNQHINNCNLSLFWVAYFNLFGCLSTFCSPGLMLAKRHPVAVSCEVCFTSPELQPFPVTGPLPPAMMHEGRCSAFRTDLYGFLTCIYIYIYIYNKVFKIIHHFLGVSEPTLCSIPFLKRMGYRCAQNQ